LPPTGFPTDWDGCSAGPEEEWPQQLFISNKEVERHATNAHNNSPYRLLRGKNGDSSQADSKTESGQAQRNQARGCAARGIAAIGIAGRGRVGADEPAGARATLAGSAGRGIRPGTSRTIAC